MNRVHKRCIIDVQASRNLVQTIRWIRLSITFSDLCNKLRKPKSYTLYSSKWKILIQILFTFRLFDQLLLSILSPIAPYRQSPLSLFNSCFGYAIITNFVKPLRIFWGTPTTIFIFILSHFYNRIFGSIFART